MKKFILAVAMLLATNVTAMAEDSNSDKMNMVEAYDIKININSLARYLELSRDQIESVEYIQSTFTECLRCAPFAGSEEDCKRLANNAIKYNLREMNCVLTKEQLKKYIKILNITLNNRGIKQ